MKIWIYTDGAQKGPFSEEELLAMNITPTTPVWFEGMSKWLPAGEVPEMAAILRGEHAASAEFTEAQPDEETKAEGSEAESAGEAGEVSAEAEGASGGTTEATGAETAAEAAATEVATAVKAEPAAGKYAPGRRVQRRAERPDEPCPPTYLGWSVFLTICCCSPVSIASLAASIFVTSYYNNGKLDKSKRASEIAAWLIMTAIALGFLPVMLMSALSSS